ncbi:MAG: SDR family NAD(P)-dependent oxidoreductase, partial [Pseudomonadota bacterium]|nr:SDR family NAD(P)-dependent oxidoreductase [Pseudomonadota bacterium]
MRGLKDKVIILTGAAGGLGQALAKRLTQEQAYPVLVDHNQSALLELSEDRSLNHPLCLSGD